MRINRFLANCGVASRRGAEAMILAGRVSINDHIITDLAAQVQEDIDVVRLDGQLLRPEKSYIYVLLNKPKGYVTTANDDRGRKTVLDLVHVPERIFPVGRLDLNSSGLLILTNDGELAFRLTHPRYKVTKTYRVGLETNFHQSDFKRLTQGLVLEDGPTQPCTARFFSDSKSKIEVVLREGRQQQVRRMFAALGYKVKTLNRVYFGPLELGDLPRGNWRYLSKNEVVALKANIGMLKK